jgi:hypothetical protein
MDNSGKRKLKIIRAPLALMKFFSSLSPAINYGCKIVEALNNYPEKFEGRQTWEELGKPGTALREYAGGLE